MTYLRVRWKHASPSDPVVIYSELDAHRMELRKLHVFADGRLERAGPDDLSYEPIPALADIATDPQFEPTEITRDDFEAAWARRD